jgi:hypothetical protein
MDHKNSLQFPDDIEISPSAKSLIQAFLCDRYSNLKQLPNIEDIQRSFVFMILNKNSVIHLLAGVCVVKTVMTIVYKIKALNVFQ